MNRIPVRRALVSVHDKTGLVETKVGPNITFTTMRDPEGNPFCFG